MASLRRFFQLPDVVWAWPLSNQPLQEARDRHAVTGVPVQGVGPWGPYLTFDGSADYVTLGAAWEDQLRFDSGTQDFSIVMWLRVLVVGMTNFFVSKIDAWTDGWYLYQSVGIPRFGVNANITASVGAIPDTNWHCLIGVVDRSAEIRLYLDGSLDGRTAAIAGPAMATTTTPRIAAASQDGSQKFGGDIAGIAVLNRVLSAAECAGIATGKAF